MANFFFVKSEYKIIRIDIEKIYYIQSVRDYIRIYIEGKEPIMTLQTMKTIMRYLSTDIFMRVHRSFIINLYKVRSIENNRIVFDSNIYIPISDQYKDDFQKFLERNILK